MRSMYACISIAGSLAPWKQLGLGSCCSYACFMISLAGGKLQLELQLPAKIAVNEATYLRTAAALV